MFWRHIYCASEGSRWSKPTSLGCTQLHPAGWRGQSDSPNLRNSQVSFLAWGRHQSATVHCQRRLRPQCSELASNIRSPCSRWSTGTLLVLSCLRSTEGTRLLGSQQGVSPRLWPACGLWFRKAGSHCLRRWTAPSSVSVSRLYSLMRCPGPKRSN